MNQVCLYDWEFIMGRDYSCNVTKDGRCINYDPYSDRFKHDIYIGWKKYPYPKTIGEFVKYCEMEGIEIQVKELKNDSRTN